MSALSSPDLTLSALFRFIPVLEAYPATFTSADLERILQSLEVRSFFFPGRKTGHFKEKGFTRTRPCRDKPRLPKREAFKEMRGGEAREGERERERGGRGRGGWRDVPPATTWLLGAVKKPM
jgi:hypothetical protein